MLKTALQRLVLKTALQRYIFQFWLKQVPFPIASSPKKEHLGETSSAWIRCKTSNSMPPLVHILKSVEQWEEQNDANKNQQRRASHIYASFPSMYAQRLLKAFRNLIYFRFNVHIVHHWVFPKDMFIAFLIAQSNMLCPCFSCLLHRSGSAFATAVGAVVVYCFYN